MIKKTIFICSLFVTFYSFIFGQSPNFQYSYYDTTLNYTGYSAAPLKDTGYVLLYTTVDQNFDYSTYIQLIDNHGNNNGAPVLIGMAEYTQGYAVLQTADSGFIAGGEAFTGATVQAFLVKTDNKGNQQWANYYGPATNYSVGFYGLAITKDGGYIIAGNTGLSYYSKTQIYVVRTNSAGDTLWTRAYGDTSLNGFAGSVNTTSDGGFIITGGQLNSSNVQDVYVLKIDSQGNKLWDNHFGGAITNVGNFGIQTKDGGYIFAGGRGVSDSTSQAYLIKTNSSGDTTWTYIDTNITSEALGVVETGGGQYVASGFNTIGANNTVPVPQTDGYLIKISSTGKKIWSASPFNNPNVLFTQFGNNVQTTDGGFLMPGTGTAYNSNFYPFGAAILVKTDSNGNISNVTPTGISQIPNINPNISVYPNPFTAQTAINVSNTNVENAVLLIFDMDGNVVKRIDNINSCLIPLDRTNLPSGMYFYRLVNDNGIIGTGKLVAE